MKRTIRTLPRRPPASCLTMYCFVLAGALVDLLFGRLARWLCLLQIAALSFARRKYLFAAFFACSALLCDCGCACAALDKIAFFRFACARHSSLCPILCVLCGCLWLRGLRLLLPNLLLCAIRVCCASAFVVCRPTNGCRVLLCLCFFVSMFVVGSFALLRFFVFLCFFIYIYIFEKCET